MEVGSHKKKRSERRKRTELIQVRVSDAELKSISEHAAAVSLGVPEFLRRLGTGYIPESRVDLDAVRELCKVAGDLGRLGGLLKLWITEKRTPEGSADSVNIANIDELYRALKETYALVKAKAEGL